MLAMQEVTKYYGRTKALDRLTLSVPQGAVYGLVGPNGAGKSTAIRHMTGILRPDSGTVTLEGLPVYENARTKALISYIPDDIFFFPSATLEEMSRFYAGLYPKYDSRLFRQLSEAFQLPTRQPLRRFSKGMQKQAAFQLSLSCRPEVLILDEPVDGLDPVMRRQVWSLILSAVTEERVTVLISSHNLRELEDICDHVGIMHQGRMLLERSLSDMQGSTHKVQLVGDTPEGLDIIGQSCSGRLKTLVVRGRLPEVRRIVAGSKPVYFDLLPLSLEEIFIYELGGVNHEVSNILL